MAGQVAMPLDPRRCGSVLVPLADLVDIRLRHQLRPGVQVGGGDAAVDLQVQLQHRPEALQERLLAERAVEVAVADLLLLRRAEEDGRASCRERGCQYV